jgi:hypothetical protein
MRFEFSKDWCLRMAQIGGDDEIGAGLVAADPTFDGEAVPAVPADEPSAAVAAGA